MPNIETYGDKNRSSEDEVSKLLTAEKKTSVMKTNVKALEVMERGLALLVMRTCRGHSSLVAICS